MENSLHFNLAYFPGVDILHRQSYGYGQIAQNCMYLILLNLLKLRISEAREISVFYSRHNRTEAQGRQRQRKHTNTCKEYALWLSTATRAQQAPNTQATRGVFLTPTRTYQTYRATPPTFLIWNNLCDLVYQQPTRSYRSQTAVA